jgi:hypothetical protein
MGFPLTRILVGIKGALWRSAAIPGERIEVDVTPEGETELRIRFRRGEVHDDRPKLLGGPVSMGASAGWKDPGKK